MLLEQSRESGLAFASHKDEVLIFLAALECSRSIKCLLSEEFIGTELSHVSIRRGCIPTLKGCVVQGLRFDVSAPQESVGLLLGLGKPLVQGSGTRGNSPTPKPP
jgi:hypothetical protein